MNLLKKYSNKKENEKRIRKLLEESKKNTILYNKQMIIENKNFIIKTTTEKNNNITSFEATTKELLTYIEKILYNNLLLICKDLHLRICPKVRLADILDAQNLELKKRTYGLHIDFTICNHRLKPILLIELDDPTHTTNKQTIANDKIKNKICEENNMPLLRIKTNDKIIYNKDLLENLILKEIKSFN